MVCSFLGSPLLRPVHLGKGLGRRVLADASGAVRALGVAVLAERVSVVAGDHLGRRGSRGPDAERFARHHSLR
jgi:hypothetical protein